jgi:hypothetical protein
MKRDARGKKQDLCILHLASCDLRKEFAMDNQDARLTVDYAAEAMNVLSRYGLTAETLVDAVSTDESGRAFNTTIALGNLVEGLTEQNEKERAPRVLSHLQRALAPQPSGRWTPLITRRVAQIKRESAPILAEMFAALVRDSSRPAAWLKALVEACETEIKTLERRRADAQAKLRQAEKELEPLQARINAFLQANASRSTITHLFELLTSLLMAVDRGVGLTAVVLVAERLVNDRESRAFTADAATAAIGILQEVRGQAQARRDEMAQFASRCRAVAGQIGSAREATQSRLAANPYADVDLTDAGLVERLGAHIRGTVMVDATHLTQFMAMDEAKLYHELVDSALAEVRKQTASLSLLNLMDMQATFMLHPGDAQGQPPEALTSDGDLVAATLEAAYQRVGSPAVELERRAAPQDWWLVGVPDETNPGFAFDNATLVGSGRRDQVQFLHVQVGIAPQDLTAFVATRESFEQALALRNYYVLEALATDDHARQVFALGLASGVIAVRGGEFCLDGDQPVRLGATAEDALDEFVQQVELVRKAEDGFDALPLAVMAERLESYLARGRSIQDELWWEFASYVRDRLELARHQMTFVS